MYILIIYHDNKCRIINSFLKFETIKDIIKWSNGLIKYSDVNKKKRTYNTAKSFFKIIPVSKEQEQKYFSYKHLDLRILK